MKKLRVGLIGMGQRGKSLLKNIFLNMQTVDVVAVCDLYQDRIDEAIKLCKEKGNVIPYGTLNSSEVINHPDVDVVFIITGWIYHIPLAIECMEAGKPVGVEVAGAYSIKQCWDLVNTYEKTKTPVMLLENCCYGRRELMCLNMAKQGVFGEIVHCDGGYCHDLRDELCDSITNGHYRLTDYINRNCENYPTHEIGPIARILDINRGNRFLTLSSFASKSAGLKEFVKDNIDKYGELKETQFDQGDIVTTVITCANGQTVRITLNTTLPRFYSRHFTVHGTKGIYEENNDSIFLNGDKDHWAWQKHWGNAKDYEEKYEHPVWKEFLNNGVRGGHGGMDWLVMNDFIDSLLENKPMPIDVYDMATWMVISVLSENSIAKGGIPVEFPDFTNGKWMNSK